MSTSPVVADTSDNTIAGLPDSVPLLGDPQKLRDRWEADGVLFFRNVIEPDAVAVVRDAYVMHLKELGAVAADAEQPVWTGLNQLDGRLATSIDDSVWQDLVQNSSFAHVVRQFLGEDPCWVPIVVHRASPPSSAPTDGDMYQGRHQDGVFNHGIDFITCWIPLMDIDQTLGGLAVAPGSHKQCQYDFTEGQPHRAGPIPAGKISDDRWRRPDYKAGDVLMFHSMTAHSGLPNLSDKFRLSMDARFLPGSRLLPVVGHVSRFDGHSVEIETVAGELMALDVVGDTMVRGPGGDRVTGTQVDQVLFADANVIAVPDGEGHARLVRSVSRKFIALPATWFTQLPAGWVT
jgi:ectoine hydroxylase-related dioxygenase (phytanoyl-CoA dioxygenase family)